MSAEEFEEDFSEEIISELDKDYVGEGVEEYDPTELPGDTNNAALAATDRGDKARSSTHDAQLGPKLFQLPLTRIRNLMKLDADVSIASNEAVFVVARCTELFIESLVRESYSYTVHSKKKTLQKRDVDLAISAVDSLMFLDGAINF